MKILFIAQELPYREVAHAGGQTFYNYLSKISDNNEVYLFSYANKDEIVHLNKLSLPRLKGFKVIVKKRSPKLLRLPSMVVSPKYYFNDIYNYALMKNKLLRFLNKNRIDMIQLEWTSSLIFVPFLKKHFPLLKLVVSEHDVNFLGLKRKYMLEKNITRKLFLYLKYRWGNWQEIKLLKYCDLILTHNEKDTDLLVEAGISSNAVHTITPFYKTYNQTKSSYLHNELHLLFYGAMNRSENYTSILKFIETVYKNIYERLNNVTLTIMGNKPPRNVISYNGKYNITVTGFVQDPQRYFDKANIFIAPLLFGAGIKIKILEAFSAGLPVVTNNIGIEGISASPGIDYIHFNDFVELEKILKHYYEHQTDLKRIGEKGKKFVMDEFKFKNSVYILEDKYRSIVKETPV